MMAVDTAMKKNAFVRFKCKCTLINLHTFYTFLYTVIIHSEVSCKKLYIMANKKNEKKLRNLQNCTFGESKAKL